MTLAAAAAVMFAGGPGDVGGPSSAAAIEQALHWLNPPAGTVLHVRSVETQGGRTTTREFWQSADDPTAERELLDGRSRYETAGDGLYDPTTNTIYVGGATRQGAGRAGADARSVGDPVVKKVRFLLEDERMTVTGRERHNGQRPGRSRSSPTPAGPCGRCGSPPTTASRSSCATPAATRTRHRRHPLGDLRGADGADADRLAHAQGRPPDGERRPRPRPGRRRGERVFGAKDRGAK